MTKGFTPAELAHLCAMTPGTNHRVHLNNAGAARNTRGVLEAVVDHLNLEAQIGGYEAKAQENERIEAVYDSA